MSVDQISSQGHWNVLYIYASNENILPFYITTSLRPERSISMIGDTGIFQEWLEHFASEIFRIVCSNG